MTFNLNCAQLLAIESLRCYCQRSAPSYFKRHTFTAGRYHPAYIVTMPLTLLAEEVISEWTLVEFNINGEEITDIML